MTVLYSKIQIERHIHPISSTYDHRVWKTGLPVRSAVLKPHAGELVVGWVTTSESSLFLGELERHLERQSAMKGCVENKCGIGMTL
ncbi:L-lysine 2-3-aminomutase [Penicillium sp. IBT 31633x]|nr:L-lysine 2-3-aminomutase [Penicillium sp. IBT 31633x]